MPHPETFFIKPAQGIRMADPKSGDYLPESGALMPRSGFWLRRLKDGDVILSAPAGVTDASAAEPPAPALVAQGAAARTPSALSAPAGVTDAAKN
ncbi:MAG: DUF2635 domain-containing protein [Deltaproteobacteria bacterium]|jgi:hypothetical protein|nr:DUF2635 domain-containing protein [Deltaproteobacteria bacterium]